MPTYVYKNIETGETFEIKQSMRDDALREHPETGAPIKRVLSAPGIAFRGSGFYANDSRPRQAADSGPAKSAAKSEASAPTSNAAGSKSGGKGGGSE